eukprot:evm.model.scf_1011EXC.2 EVM.evm.TU.scf_1011EXC.2   scf_1011EXC:18658-20091(+)
MKKGIAACLLLVVIGAVMVQHSEAILIKALLLSKLLGKKKVAPTVVPKVIAKPAAVARVTGAGKPVYPPPMPGHYETAAATKTALLGSAVDAAGTTATAVVDAKTSVAKTGVSALGTGKGLIGSTIDKLLSG